MSRSRGFALAGLLAGGLGGLITGSQAWWRARGTGGTTTGGLGTAIDIAFTGSDATGGLTAALSVVVLAGAVLVLVLRRTGRRVLGVLLGVAGLAMAVVGALRLRPSATDVADKVQQTTLLDSYRLVPTWWNLGFALAGALALAAALTMIVRAGRWPSRADRYRRDTADPARVAAMAGDPAQWWKAQDAGIDPTRDVAPDGPDVEPDDHRVEESADVPADASAHRTTAPVREPAAERPGGDRQPTPIRDSTPPG